MAEERALTDLQQAQHEVALRFSRVEDCESCVSVGYRFEANGDVTSCLPCGGTGKRTVWPMQVECLDRREHPAQTCWKCQGLGWVPNTDLSTLLDEVGLYSAYKVYDKERGWGWWFIFADGLKRYWGEGGRFADALWQAVLSWLDARGEVLTEEAV